MPTQKPIDEVTSEYLKRKHEEFIQNSDDFLEKLGRHIGHDLSPQARAKATLKYLDKAAKEEQIEAILLACEDYLERKSQAIMKER